MSKEMAVAVITAVSTLAAGVVGALIGSSVANQGASSVVSQQWDLKKEEEDRAARASARLLILELRGLHTTVITAATNACWWIGDYDIDTPVESLQLLAAGMQPPLWQDLDDVLRQHERLGQVQVAGFYWTARQPSADMKVAFDLLTALEKAIPNIANFAELQNQKLEPKPDLVVAYHRDGRAPSSAVRNSRCNDRAP